MLYDYNTYTYIYIYIYLLNAYLGVYIYIRIIETHRQILLELFSSIIFFLVARQDIEVVRVTLADV